MCATCYPCMATAQSILTGNFFFSPQWCGCFWFLVHDCTGWPPNHPVLFPSVFCKAVWNWPKNHPVGCAATFEAAWWTTSSRKACFTTGCVRGPRRWRGRSCCSACVCFMPRCRNEEVSVPLGGMSRTVSVKATFESRCGNSAPCLPFGTNPPCTTTRRGRRRRNKWWLGAKRQQNRQRKRQQRKKKQQH